MVFLSSRGRNVCEDPVRHLGTLLPSRFVPEAEMHAVVDANIDHVGRHVREATIGARLLCSLRVHAGYCEGHFVLPKEQRENAGQRRGNVIRSRSVLWIGWRVQKRLPGWVAGR